MRGQASAAQVSPVIWHPQPRQRVELHYRKSMRCNGLHLERGVVTVAGSGPGPINATVVLDDGRTAIVPRGNMVEVRGQQNENS